MIDRHEYIHRSHRRRRHDRSPHMSVYDSRDPPVVHMPIQINLRHSGSFLSPLLQELENRANRLISINVRVATRPTTMPQGDSRKLGARKNSFLT